MVCLTIRTNFRFGWLQASEVDVFGSPSGSLRACFQKIILGCPRCSGSCSSVSQVSNKWCEALSSVFLCSGGPSGSIPEVLHYQWHDRQKINIFRILGVKGTEFLNSPIYENECETLLKLSETFVERDLYGDLSETFVETFRNLSEMFCAQLSCLAPSTSDIRFGAWNVGLFTFGTCAHVLGAHTSLVRIMNVL